MTVLDKLPEWSRQQSHLPHGMRGHHPFLGQPEAGIDEEVEHKSLAVLMASC